MKPILFNTEMVRAILEGRKTVTRRLVKPAPAGDGSKPEELITRPGYWNQWSDDYVYRQPCKIGDILYVRETWKFIPCIDCEKKQCNFIPITYEDKHSVTEGCFDYRADYYSQTRIPWNPSIHMPKEAARIFLSVSDVRVERLQDITEEQARAEGAMPFCLSVDSVDTPDSERTWHEVGPAIPQFIKIWDATIKSKGRERYGWAANPWVWVISFERCEKQEDKHEQSNQERGSLRTVFL